MCGIAGFVDMRGASGTEQLAGIGRAMGDSLHHRGPDAGDVWTDAGSGVVLAHRRLSIVDLSPAGNQPMVSSCGRFVMVYNGEIYNAAELRGELSGRGRLFRGRSDTEVILEGCAVWGVEATARQLNGMFAFALWDRDMRTLTLVRDRLGIKPLYWGDFGGLFLFASELKALKRHPAWSPVIDRNAVAAYLRHNYIPAPHSIYAGVQKLLPGTMLTLHPDGKTRVNRFWSLDGAVQARSPEISDDEAVTELEALLSDAVRRRMVADVPLGGFLSGGIDSSTVVALMQANFDRPVRTFSIGFHEKGYNEADHAAAVARHLGTEHTELYVTPSDACAVIPHLQDIYDEPFADSSQIPTCLVSAMTREHVTVALSGDGGDELFAGYNRYFQARSLGLVLGGIPRPLRKLGAKALDSLSPHTWDRVARLLPAKRRPPHVGDKVHKLASVLTEEGDGFYRRLISHWDNPDEIVIGATEPKGLVWDPAVRERVPSYVDRMRYLDTLTYLPDDILTKVDRASMANSLEVRVPLLDHRVVEFAWRLPQRCLIRGGEGKWLLRQVLGRHLPQEMIDRPKMGFGVPIDSWLRGPLRDWAEALLGDERLRREGFFRPREIRQKWQEHLSGQRNWQYYLWDVLMFQAWFEKQ